MRKYAYLIILFLFISSIKISAQWFAQQSGTNDLLYGIQFVDANNGWVTNLNGTKLFHTTNGGMTGSFKKILELVSYGF